MANMYNASKQYDKAAQMAAEASKRSAGAAGGRRRQRRALFNQGVVLWNGQRYAEAKAQFEAAVKAKPNYADAHYWVGMAQPQRPARCRRRQPRSRATSSTRPPASTPSR